MSEILAVANANKTCKKCNLIKSLSDFHNSSRHKDGKNSICKHCVNQKHGLWLISNKETGKSYNKKWKEKNPEKHRDSIRKYNARPDVKKKKAEYAKNHGKHRYYGMRYKYGISKEAYEVLLSTQGNKCAICRSELKNDRNTHIDHSHKTGKIRGILCHFCNKGLGHFKDNVESLKSAIRYLFRTEGEL